MGPESLAEVSSGRTSLDEFTRAILNILEDFSSEKERLGETQRAILNILEDFAAEKSRLEATQRAVMNILEDFEEQKSRVELVNRDLRKEISERAAAEKALTQRTTQLARSNAELEQFAYVASHDLQEPLRMVSNYVQLFERRYKGQVDELADKYIRYAVDGARRMQALIGGLLEYSRIGYSDQAKEPVAFASQEALELALGNIRSVVESSEASITQGPLPRVMGDLAQISQIFQNLITNALKFHTVGVKPEVRISALRSGREYIFSVADNGIGIDPQYADRIFVIFQRLHTRTEYEGTGIGLSICKKVIERSGGRIWVESVLGSGSTFYFTLPAAQGE
jgi:light-regulated signal transduction histidine kinase (bacteriophytochrome)